MARPRRLVLVLGTGTDVGKTWSAAAALVMERAAGASVAARKPVQSFDPCDLVSTRDASVLASATGEDPATVCPPHRSIPAPLAPPMAAQALGMPGFTMADLTAELAWPENIDIGVVEAVGGVRAPMADDGDSVDLIGRLRPDAIALVADAALGTINSIRLSLAEIRRACETAALDVVPTVVMNRFDPAVDLHVRNRRWLETVDGIPVCLSTVRWLLRV